MAAQWWSWVLTAVGVFGLYLAGRRSPWGWAVGIAAQVLWLFYSINTRQWGFLVSCFAYGAVYSRNFVRWRREIAAEQVASVAASQHPWQEWNAYGNSCHHPGCHLDYGDHAAVGDGRG